MSNLLNKLTGKGERAERAAENDYTEARDTGANAGQSLHATGSTGAGIGSGSGYTGESSYSQSTGVTGASYGTGTATTGVSSGMTTGGVAHVTGEAGYDTASFQQNAAVRFSGQTTQANVTTQNQPLQVDVPGQSIQATLPAKQVIVEVPERQVEVTLPPRSIQLENNPEIEVTTRPSIRAVGGAVVSGESFATGTTGLSSGSRIDPAQNTGNY